MRIRQPAEELRALMRLKGGRLEALLWELVRSVARDENARAQAVTERLGRLLAQVLGLVRLLGRRRVAMALRGVSLSASAMDPAIVVPRVTWAEAIRQIAERYPMVVPDQVRALGPVAVQEWIGDLYQNEGFTLAKTARSVVVERIQGLLARAVKRGERKPDVIRSIIAAGEEHGDDWTQAYAETVWRNNLNTAYTAGIHEQMEHPEVKRVIGALVFEASLDGDTTRICRAAHGTLAPSDHWVWNHRSPPLHHNCRSGLRLVTHEELKGGGSLRQDGSVRAYIPNWPPAPEETPQPGFGGRRR